MEDEIIYTLVYVNDYSLREEKVSKVKWIRNPSTDISIHLIKAPTAEDPRTVVKLVKWVR